MEGCCIWCCYERRAVVGFISRVRLAWLVSLPAVPASTLWNARTTALCNIKPYANQLAAENPRVGGSIPPPIKMSKTHLKEALSYLLQP